MNPKKILLVLGLISIALAGCVSSPRRAQGAEKSALPAGAFSETTRAAAERYTLGGLPMSPRPTLALLNAGYAVGYSEELLDPVWAAYYCGPEASFPFVKTRPEFADDPRVPPGARLTHHDYDRPKDAQGRDVKPTYDRGHMAPNYAIGTRYGEEARIETFVMTNVVPQRSSMNSQTWKALEAEIARNFAPGLGGVWVTVGPIFGRPAARYNGKAVIPSALYCIVIDRRDDGTLRALALTMAQTVSGTRRIGDFFTTVDAIERQTGLDFFSGLPDDIEARLESSLPDAGWDPELTLNPSKYNGED